MVLPMIPDYPMTEEQVLEYRKKEMYEVIDKITTIIKENIKENEWCYLQYNYNPNGSIKNEYLREIFWDIYQFFDRDGSQLFSPQHLIDIIHWAIRIFEQIMNQKNVFIFGPGYECKYSDSLRKILFGYICVKPEGHDKKRMTSVYSHKIFDLRKTLKDIQSLNKSKKIKTPDEDLKLLNYIENLSVVKESNLNK